MNKLINFTDKAVIAIGHLAVDKKMSFTECLNDFIEQNAVPVKGAIIKLSDKTIIFDPETQIITDSGLNDTFLLNAYESLINRTFTEKTLEKYTLLVNYLRSL